MKYLGLVWLYGTSTIVGYIRPNPIYTYLSEIYIIFLVWFYGISTIVGYIMPNPIYTYLLKIYIIWFGLVWFYGISTIVGYLMPNSVHTYLLNIYMICKHIFLTTFLNELELIFLHIGKMFQISHTNNSIHLFLNSQKVFKYC